MLKIREAVIVEGKYDKQRLSEFIDAPIITTSGFRVFRDKEKQQLIRKLARERGLIIMTDSDSAGFVIRNFLKGITGDASVKNCYIPLVEGKEKRKDKPSKEGTLGVEGLSVEMLKDALSRAGVTDIEIENSGTREVLTKTDMYEMGLCGKDNSKSLRDKLLRSLGFPTYLSSNALLELLNDLYTKEEILDKLKVL